MSGDTLGAFEPMKRLLGVGVISLGLVSCNPMDEMRIQCAITNGRSHPKALIEKADKYISDKTGISSEIGIFQFCNDYLSIFWFFRRRVHE